MNQYDVYKNDENWVVKYSENKSASKYCSTQAEAIEYARQYAKNNKSEVAIHGRDGAIRQKNSYGRDTFPPKS